MNHAGPPIRTMKALQKAELIRALDLYPKREAAARLGISLKTLYNLCHANGLAARYIRPRETSSRATS